MQKIKLRANWFRPVLEIWLLQKDGRPDVIALQPSGMPRMSIYRPVRDHGLHGAEKSRSGLHRHALCTGLVWIHWRGWGTLLAMVRRAKLRQAELENMPMVLNVLKPK